MLSKVRSEAYAGMSQVLCKDNCKRKLLLLWHPRPACFAGQGARAKLELLSTQIATRVLLILKR